MSETCIHPTAAVSEKAEIGDGAAIWMNAQIREDVRIGRNCIIGRNTYIENGVTLGDNGNRIWICTRDGARYRMREKGNLAERNA